MSFQSFPFIVGWELTLKCNLRCKHCASSAGLKRNNELTLKKSLAICDELPDLLVNEVIFTGGEPLLNPFWDRIASHLRIRGIKSGMVTNGILLTEDIIAKMKDCGMNSLGISIDGTESIHDQIRGIPGLFRKTISSIEWCIKSGISVSVITLVSGMNIHELDSIYQIVKSTGAWKWQLQPIFPLGRSKENEFLSITEDQYLNLGMYIHKRRTGTTNESVQIVPADSCGYFSVLDFPEFGWQGCGAGRFSCGIMSDGRVKGCLSWPDYTVEGDLHKDDLWTIWFRDGAFSKLRQYDRKDLEGDCSDCDVGIECGGGCQAMSIATKGKWRSDPFCYHSLLKKHPGSVVNSYLSNLNKTL
jgi:radical SAM protein with 4Fe4S-binding SPASM domain